MQIFEDILLNYVFWYRISEKNKSIASSFFKDNLIKEELYREIKAKVAKDNKKMLSKYFIDTLGKNILGRKGELNKYQKILFAYYYYEY